MIENIIFLNKPADCSSFDCVRQLKQFLPRRTKIGHAGTLDPFATGLLIIAIGRGATKYLSRFMGLPKTYTATARLHEVTDTLDGTGTIVETSEQTFPTAAQITTAITDLGASYIQAPPAYSALKHQGKPLYKLARTQAISPEAMARITAAKQREVQLYQCSLDNYDPPFFTITTQVSQGTYIRTLMHDIAQRAGSIGATTHTLHRQAIGPFDCSRAIPRDQITAKTLESCMIPVTDILYEIGSV